MKGTYFNKSIEWNLETDKENWHQGELITGKLKIKNHDDRPISMNQAGVALAYAEIKKVHSRTDGALKIEQTENINCDVLNPKAETELNFSFKIDQNAFVSDKKASYYLSFGQEFIESHLQIKVLPRTLYSKVITLIDTFYRFKVKEIKSSKKGVEFKLIPPTARDMSNIDSLNLIFSTDENDLKMDYEFHIKKLDTTSVVTKVQKEIILIKEVLGPKEYSLGKDLLNQDMILKSIEKVISNVKIKSIF